MKKITKNSLWVLGILILAVALFYAFRSPTGNVIANGQYDDFAECLTEKEIISYGTDWCSFCKRQKDLFGPSFSKINFVDCDKNRQECINAGVQGYPTWKINGQNYPGLQSLEKLSELSGCELK